jgi:voltage-gated sodium channel
MQERLSAADAADTPRAAVARLTLSPLFQRGVVALILLNAVTLGLETSDTVMERWGGALELIDAALLWVFTAELALRVYAFRGRFFRDPWGLFDLAVVGIAWLPATGALSVLRALRILRVLRLVSVVPSLRVVVEAMLAALPGMGSIVLLMALLFYVFAVMAVKLYGEDMPEAFGTLGASLFTLFQLMTLDDWANIVKPAMERHPLALLFFLPFILVATFVVRRKHPEPAGRARSGRDGRGPGRGARGRRRAAAGNPGAARGDGGAPGGARQGLRAALARPRARGAGCAAGNGEERPWPTA